MIQRHNRELCGRPERPIRLRAITPHRPADPVGSYAFADLIDSPGAVAMGNDARIWHSDAERVLTLFDIAGVYAGGRDPNANLAGPGRGSGISPTTNTSRAAPASRTKLPSFANLVSAEQ